MDIQTVACPLLHNLSEQTNYVQIVQIGCFRFVVKQAVCSDGYTTKHLVRDTLRPDKTADNLPYEKVGNNEPVCIADEVPFDIPDSWEWAKIETISMPIGNKNNQIRSKEVLPTGKISVVSQGKDLIDGYCNDVSKKIDVLPLVMFGDHTRNVKYIDFEFVIGADGTKFHKILSCNSEYIYYWMLYAAETLRNRGYARHYTLLKECFIPLPPLQEQVRIVSKIKATLPLVEKYGCEENKRVSLDSAFPNLLKKSILQEAVQGKLVPQDPADEPAFILLDRIRAKKEQLIKAGKIKRDKHESVIFRRDNSHYEKRGSEEVCIDDEILFEVPSSWALIRLKDIGIYRKGPFGSSLTKSMFVPKGDDTVKVYEQKNAIQKDHTLGTYYITRQYYESKMKSFTVEPGDILVSCAGTIGETYVLPEQIELGIINQALMRMTIDAPIDLNYFLMYFDYVLKQTAKDSSKGSAIKNIPPFEIFKKLILPLPPIEEQKRIVMKVRELENLCNLLY